MKNTTDRAFIGRDGITVRGACPYCGHGNVPCLEHTQDSGVIWCDVEEGGCDNPFFIHVEYSATVDAYAIEGAGREATQ